MLMPSLTNENSETRGDFVAYLNPSLGSQNGGLRQGSSIGICVIKDVFIRTVI